MSDIWNILVHVTVLFTVSEIISLLYSLFSIQAFFYLYFILYVNVYKMIPGRIICFLFYNLLLCIKVYTENYNMKCLNYFAQSCNGPVGGGG